MWNTYLYTKSTFPQSKQKPNKKEMKNPHRPDTVATGGSAESVETENVAQNTNRNLL